MGSEELNRGPFQYVHLVSSSLRVPSMRIWASFGAFAPTLIVRFFVCFSAVAVGLHTSAVIVKQADRTISRVLIGNVLSCLLSYMLS